MKKNIISEPNMNVHDQPISDKMQGDLPAELAKPALRALVGAGYLRLEQFTKLSEA